MPKEPKPVFSQSRLQLMAEMKKAGVRSRRSQPEHDEQVLFFKTLARNVDAFPDLKWIHAIPNGGHRHKATAGKLRAEGVTPGVADIFVPIPIEIWCGMYIEMKAGKNKLSEAQEEFKEFVTRKGYPFVTAWSAEEALVALEAYLKIKLIRLKP